MLKIGIPRALLYYYYYPLWETFFEKLGMEVIVSEETNKKLIDEGIKITVQEICVPIKIFNGHVLDLLKKNVDYIFVPRMISVRNMECFCPKFMGLPDMVKSVFEKDIDKFIFTNVDSKSDCITDAKSYSGVSEKLGIPMKTIKSALKAAEKRWKEFRQMSYDGYSIDEISTNDSSEAHHLLIKSQPAHHSMSNKAKTEIKIGLIGYVYNIYDEFVSMDIVNRLKEMGVSFTTFEMLTHKQIDKGLARLDKKLFWTFSNKILGAGYHFLDDDSIDGIIHVTAFVCGPDSYIGKMMELDAEQKHKPFLTVRVDEHTGESHIITRLEAFVEMIKIAKVAKRLKHEGRALI